MAKPGFVTPKKRPLEPVEKVSMLPEGMGSTTPGTPYSPARAVKLHNVLAPPAERRPGAFVTPDQKGLGPALGALGQLPGEPPALNPQPPNPGTPFLERVNQAEEEEEAAEAEAKVEPVKAEGGRRGKKSHKKHHGKKSHKKHHGKKSHKKSHKKHRKTRRRVRFDRI